MIDDLPSRRPNRLFGYDYSRPGYYFITVCTAQHRCLFGNMQMLVLEPTNLGRICQQEWENLAQRFFHIALDEYVLMPNHLHGIIQICDDFHGKDVHHTQGHVVKGSLAVMIQSFKAAVTNKARILTGVKSTDIWQRGYWDRILRNEKELEICRYYIQNNVNRWVDDRYFPTVDR